MQALNDQELIEQMRRGKQMALTELYRRYKDPVFFKCMSILSDADCSMEVVQDVFLALWKNRETVNAIAPSASEAATIRLYLYKAAQNASVNMAKRLNRLRALHVQLPETAGDSIIDEREGKEADPRIGLLMRAIERMPAPSQRKAFKAVYLDQMEPEEVSRMMGISSNTFYRHLQRAKIFLKNKFNPDNPIL